MDNENRVVLTRRVHFGFVHLIDCRVVGVNDQANVDRTPLVSMREVERRFCLAGDDNIANEKRYVSNFPSLGRI